MVIREIRDIRVLGDKTRTKYKRETEYGSIGVWENG